MNKIILHFLFSFFFSVNNMCHVKVKLCNRNWTCSCFRLLMYTPLAVIFPCYIAVAFLHRAHSPLHTRTHTHTPHPALILQHVKFSSETQILHSRLSKLVCRRLQWAWTRLLHFWPRGDTLAGAPHYKCVVAPLAVRRNANNAPPAQGRSRVCQSVHQRLIQSGQRSGSKAVSDLLIPTEHSQDCFFFCFLLQTIASAALGKTSMRK